MLGRSNFTALLVREVKTALARYFSFYTLERSDQAYRLNGRTPAQALREALALETL